MLMLLEAWDGITPFPECCILKAKKIFIENRPHDPGTRFSFPFCKMELESDNCPNFQRLASSSKEYSKTYQFPRPPDTLCLIIYLKYHQIKDFHSFHLLLFL
jgi:hypothetical protein